MEQIISVSGIKYKVMSDNELTSLQMADIVEKMSCNTCGNNIKTLTATCTRTTAKVGDIVTMAASATGGTPPYTIQFKKAGTNLTGCEFTDVPSLTEKTCSYTVLSTDTFPIEFSVLITDVDSQTCTESCSVTLTPTPTPTSITNPSFESYLTGWSINGDGNNYSCGIQSSYVTHGSEGAFTTTAYGGPSTGTYCYITQSININDNFNLLVDFKFLSSSSGLYFRVVIDDTVVYQLDADGISHENISIPIGGFTGTHTLKLGSYHTPADTVGHRIEFDNLRISSYVLTPTCSFTLT